MRWCCYGFPTGIHIGQCLYVSFREHCLTEFKPVVYRRFVDDTFLLFRSAEHVEKF